MKKQLLILCLFIILAVPSFGAVNADGQTLTINGETIEKVANELTFDGDNVIIHFDDGTQQTADMSTVTLSFSATTGIGGIHTFTLRNATDGVLDIDGLDDGQTVQVFSTDGKLVATAKAGGAQAHVDVRNAKNGVYIVRAGKNIVKFIKH